MSVERGVLTQEQIDALVSAISTGQIQAPKPGVIPQLEKYTRPYDFRSPDKLTKENLRALNLIYEDFSRITGNALSAHVRTSVDINVAKTDQTSFGELMFGETDKSQEAATPGIIVLFNLSPLPGSGLLQMELPLVFTIIDRMLGGPGWPTNKMRQLTALEREILQVVVRKIMGSFRDVWSKYRTFEPRILVVESDPRMVPRVIPFHDIMVRTIFGVKIGETFGLMRLALPYLMVNPLLNLVEKEEGGSHPKFRQERRLEEILIWLGKIRLPVTIELGSTMVTAREVLELEPGHVIQLEKKVEDPVEVRVEQKVKLGGQLGLIGERKAVQITKIFREEIENG